MREVDMTETTAPRPRWRFWDDTTGPRLLLWGLPALLVAVTLLANIGSGVSTTSNGSPQVQVTCEGFTGIEEQGPDCANWTTDVIASGIPDGQTADRVMRLTIKQALFGLVDQCTAAYEFIGGATAEREIECR
jgi:hypothetical protein